MKPGEMLAGLAQSAALSLSVTLCLTWWALAPGAGAQDSADELTQQEFRDGSIEAAPAPATMSAADARLAADLALAWLVSSQNADGSWGSGVMEGLSEYGFSVASFPAWQLSSHGLALLALLECEPNPERFAALEKGVDWLCEREIPRRGSDWDNDAVWGYLYGFVAATQAYDDARLDESRRERLRVRAGELLELLVANQTPDGGWAYYDDPPFSQRPVWATSFCTALVLPTLVRAQQLEWLSDPKVLERAARYVERCALPTGAYEYDLNPVPRITGGEHINRVKGSLGRIQVCNWARARSGDPKLTAERLAEGLDAFFEHHKFLDVARMRPIPHEAYYANAGYFYFFGHYYAALAIELLPEAEREAYRAKLRPHLIKTLRESGSTSDFLASSYLITASTSFLILALEYGIDGSTP